MAASLGADVIYLAFSSVTDALEFTHCLPRVDCAPFAIWRVRGAGTVGRSRGSPEPWEKAAFFARTRDVLSDLLPDDPDREIISHMYRENIVAQGNVYPLKQQRSRASNDPDFETKAADVIELYLNLPQHAAVFCVDEKTARRRALSRNQA